MAETFFLSREKLEKDPAEFGEQAVDMTQSAAESTGTFAWLTTKNNQRIDQVKIGRAYCRINIQTAAMGLAQQDTVQMLFRLGRAKPTQHSARRAVQSIVQVWIVHPL